VGISLRRKKLSVPAAGRGKGMGDSGKKGRGQGFAGVGPLSSISSARRGEGVKTHFFAGVLFNVGKGGWRIFFRKNSHLSLLNLLGGLSPRLHRRTRRNGGKKRLKTCAKSFFSAPPGRGGKKGCREAEGLNSSIFRLGKLTCS